jgi:hypothetical protein
MSKEIANPLVPNKNKMKNMFFWNKENRSIEGNPYSCPLKYSYLPIDSASILLEFCASVLRLPTPGKIILSDKIWCDFKGLIGIMYLKSTIVLNLKQ